MRSSSREYATISASRTTFWIGVSCGTVHPGTDGACGSPSASRTAQCTACLSNVESRPLLLYMVIFENPLGCTWTWICARSPSYLVSAQTAALSARRGG
jgi:hypothetical protein